MSRRKKQHNTTTTIANPKRETTAEPPEPAAALPAVRQRGAFTIPPCEHCGADAVYVYRKCKTIRYLRCKACRRTNTKIVVAGR